MRARGPEPSGTVSLIRSGAGTGSLPASCSLASDGDSLTFTSTCPVTYTPTSVAGTHTVKATYDESSSALHASSTGSGDITVNLRTTTTTLNCTPLPAQIGQTVTCTATVTDTDPAGAKLNPQGTVTFTKDANSGGSCSLVSVPSTSDKIVVLRDVHLVDAAGLRDHRHVRWQSEQSAAQRQRVRSGAGRVLRPERRVRDRRRLHPPRAAMVPSGPCRAKDNYGFVAKYKKGTATPRVRPSSSTSPHRTSRRG